MRKNEAKLEANGGMKALIEGVRAHARKNYSAGWDVVIECFTDAELEALIAGHAVSVRGAISVVSRAVVAPLRGR